ncbi:BTAD domain-containing putative transcriptional regulator [Dactylosporangium sp. NPDC005555]|uniref:BTAD domain-containing putative transcriptional regulator n=1 Tax=Dactylosporangium sp. NPDC005555 TaxID=3154889 RepID=UPI00339FE127
MDGGRGMDGGGRVGELVRAARRAAGVSQRQLADRAGMSVGAVRDLEQGRTRRPQPQTVEALIAGLGLTGGRAAALRTAAGPAEPAQPVDADGPPRVSVLGPATVHRGARSVAVGSGRQRVLLGRLALSAGTAVAVSELVDLLWDTEPPVSAAHAVHTYVSRLRATLDPAGTDRTSVIGRTPGGYRLDLGPDRLDLADFRQRVERARTAPPADALDLLEAALAMWRGGPLADVPELRHHPLVTAVANERVTVALRFAGVALSAGQAGRCLPVLWELATADPLHEPLHARLIAALAASDLQAAALTVYRGIRRRLVDDLGVEPGPDLLDAHRRVLRQEPVPVHTVAVVPAQLPPDVAGFAGRTAELAELDRIVEAGQAQPTAVVIAAISGTAGVGKTALAVRWAHRVRVRYPDGQVYLNLRGYDPDEPVSAADALRQLLRAVGGPGADLPDDVDERAARFRTQVADRRMLILLDNAATVEQVRPLLPGTASCTVLVTSRDRLAGLVAVHGARRVDVGLLSVVEAGALLRRLIGDRAEAEPAAAVAMAELCARLPLALRIAAELVVSRPDATMAELAAELGDQRLRLALLDAGGDPRASVAAAFSWSLRHLPPAAARLFVLLALHPGADADVYAAAALADVTVPEARRLLAPLVRGRMLDATPGGRFAMHDLLRAYALGPADGDAQALARDGGDASVPAGGGGATHVPAGGGGGAQVVGQAGGAAQVVARGGGGAQVAGQAGGAAWVGGTGDGDVSGPGPVGGDAVRAARTRLFDHCAAAAAAAMDVLFPAARRHRPVVPPTATTPPLPDRDAARAWLEAELAGLTAVVRSAARHGRPGHAVVLARTLFRYLAGGSAVEALAVHRAAFDAAVALGDARGAGYADLGLGKAQHQLGRLEAAAGHFRRARTAFEESGDPIGLGRALYGLGGVDQVLHRHAQAAGHYRAALATFREEGDDAGVGGTLINLGMVCFHLGEHEAAAGHYREAITVHRRAGDRSGEATALTDLGIIETHRGEPRRAAGHHARSLALFLEAGDRHGEAWARNGLGEAATRAGRPADALADHAAALDTAVRAGIRDQQARAHAGLGHAHRASHAPGLAREHFARALALYDDLGVPEAAELRAQLATTND